MNIIITAGGTSEPIDGVRKITNMSTGKLGLNIANEILNNKNFDGNLFYICSKYAEKPISDKVTVIEFETVDDLENAIVATMKNPIDYFIHSAAVSDFKVDGTFSMNTACEEVSERLLDIRRDKPVATIVKEVLSELKMDNSTKIHSNNTLMVRLTPTKKLISLIKTMQPNCFLVGFKLLNNVIESNLFDVAFNLLRKNHCNLVLANDLNNIRNGFHLGLLVYPEKRYDRFMGKENIAKALVETMFARGNTKHPKSVQIDDITTDNNTVELFHSIGNQLANNNFLPTVEGGTYGNFSIKENNKMIITGRNINKMDIQKKDLTIVDDVIPTDEKGLFAKVYYHGKVKPSIDSAIHHKIYQLTNHKAIIHIHTDHVFDHLPMNEYNFPCGTQEELNSIIKFIDHDIIQLKKHGLIVMGDSLQECVDKILTLFSQVKKHVISYQEYDASMNPIWQEWIDHYKLVQNCHDKNMMDFNNFKFIVCNEIPVGVLYTEDYRDTINFVLYTSLATQRNKQKLNIGDQVINDLAKNHVRSISVMTVPACYVISYYLSKDFIISQKDGDMFYLTKYLRA